jgi:DNA-binding MarR family transcriptional regulator
VVSGIRLLARLARVAEQTCQSQGVSLPQYRLLVAASGTPERASSLATAVGVTRPTLTSLVNGLEEAGLLRRTALAGDRRGVCLELTEGGRKAIQHVEHALAARLLELIDGDQREVVDAVRDVISNVGASLDREGRVAVSNALGS